MTIRCNVSGRPGVSRDMGAHGEARVQYRAVLAAISIACLAVTSAACSGASTSTAPPATAGVTTPAPITPAATTSPPGADAQVDTHIKVYGNCTTPSIEPAEIVLACADYGELLEGLHWTSWTTVTATAVGTLVYNDCTPNCAEGHHHRVPGTKITLTTPAPGAGGQVVWSQIQENPEPPGYETGPYHGGPQPLPVRPV